MTTYNGPSLKYFSAAKFLRSQRGNQKFQQLVLDKNPKNILDFTLHEIESLEDQLQPQQSKRQQVKEIKTQGASKIYDDGSLQVIEVTSSEASCYYAKNTRWCTSDPDTASGHLKNGPLYVVIENNQKIAQLHVPSRQFVDAKDNPIDPKKLGSLMYLLLSPRTNSELILDLSILTKQPLNKEDLELIKTDPQSAVIYATKVLISRFPAAEPYIMKSPQSAVEYARYVLKSPWPEAEPYIMKIPYFAILYARYVLKSRFPAAEPDIMKNPESAFLYASYVLKSPWPAAEPYIKKHPQFAVQYAKYVLESRFPAAEPYIMKDPKSAVTYARYVLKSRFSAAEPYIMKDPNYAIAYAMFVLKSRWPEAEPSIMKHPSYALLYANTVLTGQARALFLKEIAKEA